jgi:phospholipase A-2-activating protein
LIKVIQGQSDVVRALCRLPKNNAYGASFASAGNDAVIRLWNVSGAQLAEFHGHENFIYSIASLPTGELVSSGEDRTVRIWRDGQCVQTISHPAISVWAVNACQQNGDIVSGASDRIARVFTRDSKRVAEEATIREFSEAVSASAIPQQALPDINKEKLPGPQFLQQKSGTKEGQVVMIKQDDGSVTAHQWSTSSNTWINVGTVVDAVGSSGKKKDYLGQDYDYVFDVDVEEGKPPLKLPFNLSQNPYDAANKFIQDNELPITYLEEVANFIVRNTQGATLGQPASEPTDSDPLSGARYRPGDISNYVPPSPRSNILPQKTYLTITQASTKTIIKKLEEFNQSLISGGDKEYALNPNEFALLSSLATSVETPAKAGSVSSAELEVVLKAALLWPAEKRLPGLDLLRLTGASIPILATYRDSQKRSIIDIVEASGVFDSKDRPNDIMLSVRLFANLFNSSEGILLMQQNFDKVQIFLLCITSQILTKSI